MEIIIIFLVITFLFLLSGFPVAFILSGISLLFALIGVTFGYFDYSFLMAFPNRLYGVMGNQNLLAVPLFIFMGLILEKTKIAENLIHDMNAMFNETDSGYAISVVVVGALMAASTGIVSKCSYPRPTNLPCTCEKWLFSESCLWNDLRFGNIRASYPTITCFNLTCRCIVFIISASSVEYGSLQPRNDNNRRSICRRYSTWAHPTSFVYSLFENSQD